MCVGRGRSYLRTSNFFCEGGWPRAAELLGGKKWAPALLAAHVDKLQKKRDRREEEQERR